MSDSLRRLTFAHVIIISALLRIGLIVYSEWHDAHSVVKYTDIDYHVFTDAARFLLRRKPRDDFYREPRIAQGPLGRWSGLGDAYERETYRYSPLLAALMTPNILLHPSFGKLLFAACDILVGILLYRLLLSVVLPRPTAKPRRGSTDADALESCMLERDRKRAVTLYAALHLLNPLVFSISTRGSSESTVGALVVATLACALERRWDATAVLLGVATHWKIYPVIYAASLATALSEDTATYGRSDRKRGTLAWLCDLVNRRTLRFALLSGGTFMLLNIAMYLIWGDPFVHETFLYHIHRRDHRHNFAPHFLPTYLAYPAHHLYPSSLNPADDPIPAWRAAARSPLASFGPQMLAALGTGVLFGRRVDDLPFAWFVQTAAFVTYNKVCTSQYFLWYLTLLPLVLPSLRLSRTRGTLLVVAWAAAQGLWLQKAYELEFLGRDVFVELWVRSVLFLLANTWVLAEVVKAYKPGVAREGKGKMRVD